MIDPLLPPYGDYIIFADESGSPYLTSIEKEYPVFVLVFCLVRKDTYADQIQPLIKKLKFEFFGHDMTLLHSNAIRKPRGEFTMLLHPERRNYFFERLNNILSEAEFHLIAQVVHKQRLIEKYANPFNPYNIALRMCLEQAHLFLKERGQTGKITHVIAESRGEKEDKDLELEFWRILDHSHDWGMANKFNLKETPFDLRFVEKKINSAGLQFADLVSQPIGRSVIASGISNRGFEVIKPKIWRKVWVFP